MSAGDTAGGPTAQELVRQMRADIAANDEPVHELDRTVRCDGSSPNSPTVNISSEARDIVGFDVGDDVVVRVYRDRVTIIPAEE